MAQTMTDPRPVLLLTRPAEDSERFLSALGELAIEVIVSPTTRIDHLPPEPVPPETEGVILTSANAVPCLGRATGLTAWCVGDRTATAATRAGLSARVGGGSAKELIALIKREAPKGPLLYLRGRHVAVDVAGQLRSAGLQVAERVVYRQVIIPLSSRATAALGGKGPVILPLFSPRSAHVLGDVAGSKAPLHVVAISPAVAKAASALLPKASFVAERPDMAAMVSLTRMVAASF